jgi:uncharacterized protein with HEPN domain
MKRNETVYLQHIIDAIARIEEYLQGSNEATFNQKHLVQDGVIRQLEIIGEAVRHLSNSLRIKYPHVPWQDIAGTRDKRIHDYFGIDLEKVWVMVQEDIPSLKIEVEKILNDLNK